MFFLTIIIWGFTAKNYSCISSIVLELTELNTFQVRNTKLSSTWSIILGLPGHASPKVKYEWSGVLWGLDTPPIGLGGQDTPPPIGLGGLDTPPTNGLGGLDTPPPIGLGGLDTPPSIGLGGLDTPLTIGGESWACIHAAWMSNFIYVKTYFKSLEFKIFIALWRNLS